MPRFHFNVYDAISLPDRAGRVLLDQHEARKEATLLAGTLIQEDASRLAEGVEWYMEVTDHRGLVLYRLDFAVSETAATMQAVPDGKCPVVPGA